MVYRNPKAIEVLPHMKAKSSICPKKKQRELIFDRDVLTCEYHCAMLAGLSLIGETLIEKAKNAEKLNVLVLGTGAGVFSMFLRHHFAAQLDSLVTVDINPAIVKAAQEYFGFHPDATLRSEIADAYEFVNSAKPESFDIVIMDVNYEEGDIKVSPPKKFFEPDFIRQLHAIAKPTALIAINTIIDESHKPKLLTQIRQVKESIKFITKAQNDKNEVLLFAKGLKDAKAIDESQKRTQLLTKAVEAMGLNKGVLLNKKTMQVVLHTELMRRL